MGPQLMKNGNHAAAAPPLRRRAAQGQEPASPFPFPALPPTIDTRLRGTAEQLQPGDIPGLHRDLGLNSYKKSHGTQAFHGFLFFFAQRNTLHNRLILRTAEEAQPGPRPTGRALGKAFSPRKTTNRCRGSSRYRLSRYYTAANNAFTRLVKRETLREAFFLWMEPFTAVFSITGIANFSASWA